LLPRALGSVLSQDFQDLELIVVDDGSTDETPEVIARRGDPRLRYIRFAENRGIGAARHTGVEAARGDLIAFNDSDDVWLPGKLAYQVTLFQEQPHVDVLFGNYHNVNEVQGGSALGFAQTDHGFRMLRVHPVTSEVWEVLEGLPVLLLLANPFATPTVMLRRRVFAAVGNFRTDLSGPEDFEFWFRAAVKGARFAYTTRPLIERHKDAQSITARTVTFVPRYLQALDYCEATAREAGRLDLIPLINRARHRAWRTLVHAYADQGDRKAAVHAFRQCLRYGFSPRALWYLAGALLGPEAIARFRQARDTLVHKEPPP
jgi:glycosyltransferase involved in cell wall biosynthesis